MDPDLLPGSSVLMCPGGIKQDLSSSSTKKTCRMIKTQRLRGASKVIMKIWTFRGAEKESESERGEKGTQCIMGSFVGEDKDFKSYSELNWESVQTNQYRDQMFVAVVRALRMRTGCENYGTCAAFTSPRKIGTEPNVT